MALVRFAAACLPPEYARTEATEQLDRLAPGEKVQHLFVLGQFRDASTLDWIEANAGDPLTHQWGDLAAVAGLSWGTVTRWLEAGRPLSLIALDALVACHAHPGQAMWVQEARPRLLGCPDKDDAADCLRAYETRDSVPRVRKAVAYILKHLDKIRGD